MSSIGRMRGVLRLVRSRELRSAAGPSRAAAARFLLPSVPARPPLCRFLSASSSSGSVKSGSSNDDAVAATAPSATAFADIPGVESPGEKFVMLYTCAVCETRAAKTISKHAYSKGVVLVRCPSCEKLHLIADHLGWFDDESVTVESILAAKGESVRVLTHENVLELTDLELLGQLRKDE